MINYSTVLRKNPQKPEEAKKAYALAQYTTVMTLEEFAKHIADHGCTYDRADVQAILTKAVDCMREKFLEGVRIRLGDLGVFYVSLECEGAPSLAEFTIDYIKNVRVNWTPGDNFLNLVEKAEFNHVSTRDVAQKVLKAQKAGSTTVDITPTAGSATDSNSGSGSSSTTGSGTDSGSGSGTDTGTGSGDELDSGE